MAGKVLKFADKIKKIKRTATIDFPTDDGDLVSFKIESRSQSVIDEINAKYESKKPKVPTKRLPSVNGKVKIVEDTNDPEYKAKLAEVQKLNFAELALAFLAEEERPEGTLEEQIQQILEVELAGFIPKIVERGLEISGLIDEKNYEEEVEEAKNN